MKADHEALRFFRGAVLVVEDVVVLDGDSQKYRRTPRRLVVAPESELREFIPR